MSEYRLLIVDDDVVIHRLFSDIGESRGYAVRAVNAIDAFRIEYDDFKPTLIFLDLKLLEGDGVEVLRYLAEIECKCPIVIISGHDTRVRASMIRLGESRGLRMSGTFQKPVDVMTLTNVLESHKSMDIQHSVEDLKQAIESNQFVLHFQPKLEIKTKKIIGAEALVRWQIPNKNLIYPDHFIPFAERTGFIRRLSRHIIKMTMQHMYEHKIDLQLSINLSGRDLLDLNLPDEVAECAKKYNIDPSKICFEITETAVMGQPKIAMDILTRLRINDFSLSMDDFGTGYSSLIELYRMPFNEIKIDKSFIINMHENSDTLPIVRSIINLGKNLNLSVVAEGVETLEAWNILEQENCDFAQGYLISRPMAMTEFSNYLHSSEVIFKNEKS